MDGIRTTESNPQFCITIPPRSVLAFQKPELLVALGFDLAQFSVIKLELSDTVKASVLALDNRANETQHLYVKSQYKIDRSLTLIKNYNKILQTNMEMSAKYSFLSPSINAKSSCTLFFINNIPPLSGYFKYIPEATAYTNNDMDRAIFIYSVLTKSIEQAMNLTPGGLNIEKYGARKTLIWKKLLLQESIQWII